MNGYDFDDTIFRGNSTRRFAFFCAVRFPYMVIFLPVLLVAVVLRGLRIIDKNKYLHIISSYVALVPNVQKLIVKFWDKNINRVKAWYLKQKRDDDVIISASPCFIVQEACKRLGVSCIATNLDTRARLVGKHCYGDEKVAMYKERYGDTSLDTYYSDSMSDTPMFEYAKRGYFVKGELCVQLYENGNKFLPVTYNRKQICKYMDVLSRNGYYNLNPALQRKFLPDVEAQQGKRWSLQEFYEIFSTTTFGWDFYHDGRGYWIAHSAYGFEICCEDAGNEFWKRFDTAQELFEDPCFDGKCLNEVYDEISWEQQDE